MDRALVIVEATDSAKSLIREAGELAAGVDAELVLLHVTSEDDYNQRLEAMASIPEAEVTYSVGQALEGARQFARDVGDEVLTDVDVEWEAEGAIGETAEEALRMADELDCDQIFIAGRKRSPAGKALFGDDAQSVVLGFDGAVTVLAA